MEIRQLLNRGLLPLMTVPMLLTACAGDEPSENSSANRQIRFAAQADAQRAGDVTTNNLTQFNVYAYTEPVSDANPTPYMNNVTVSKSSSNTWTYSPVAYWPSKGKLSFYAYAPAGWVGSDGPLKSVPYDIYSQSEYYPGITDLVYAVSPDLSGDFDSPNAQVIFNFRHALSKVTVRMSSTNERLVVKVSNVAIMGTRSRGNFNFPQGNTADALSTSNVGTWTGVNTPMPIVLHFSQSPEDQIVLTTTPTDMGDTGMGMGGSKYLIPQLLSWRSNGYGNDTYITVMCSVYDKATGEKLWPNENTPEDNIVQGSTFGDGHLKFPLSTSAFSEWRPGYHYVYNLIINSNEEMGTIEFGTPSVDSYVDVSTTYQ